MDFDRKLSVKKTIELYISTYLRDFNPKFFATSKVSNSPLFEKKIRNDTIHTQYVLRSIFVEPSDIR